MNNFLKGVLIGVGIGLLVAPMKGEETRRKLMERAGEFRGYLPENEQLQHYGQQVSHSVAKTAGNLKGYAQQAATSLKSSAGNLGSIAQQANEDVMQTGQDVARKTKETVGNIGQDVANRTRQATRSTTTE
jgi:gas vesicle protein